MKQLFFPFILLLLCCAGQAQNNTDWDALQLKGKVRSFTEVESVRNFKDGKWSNMKITASHKKAFDNTGRYTETVELDSLSGVTSSTTYNYNDADKTATVSFFDKEGKLTGKWVWHYNARGDLVQILYYNKSGQLNTRHNCTFDNSGHMLTKHQYKNDSTLYFTTRYTYDSKGHWLTQDSYKGDTVFYSSSQYTYDNNGYVASEITQVKGLSKHTLKYINDSKGNQLDIQTLTEAGEVKSRVVNTYDVNGNPLTKVHYNGLSEVLYKFTFEYEYDLQKNWTKITQYNEEGEAISLTERKLQYY